MASCSASPTMCATSRIGRCCAGASAQVQDLGSEHRDEGLYVSLGRLSCADGSPDRRSCESSPAAAALLVVPAAVQHEGLARDGIDLSLDDRHRAPRTAGDRRPLSAQPDAKAVAGHRAVGPKPETVGRPPASMPAFSSSIAPCETAAMAGSGRLASGLAAATAPCNDEAGPENASPSSHRTLACRRPS